MSQPRSILEDPVRSEPVAPAPSAAPAEAACPRCGAALRPEQDWCLNCGTAVTTRVAGASGWRAPVAIVAGVLALALAGLVAAFVAVSEEPQRISRAPATNADQIGAPAATPTPAAPTPEPDPISPDTIPPATGGDQSPATDEPPASSSPSSTVGSWPAGESAWTVVLHSSRRRAGATARAERLSQGGTDVGILDSDDYKSLRSGYFVVFSGQYDTQRAAENALENLRSDAPQAYVRRVTPR